MECVVPSYTENYTIEVDSIPQQLFEYANDWSACAITRLMAEPLFIEEPERQISSKMIENIQRVDDNQWLISISEKATWNNGFRITALDICQQIMKAGHAKSSALAPFSFIKRMEVKEDFLFLIKTKWPVAHLNRILASPSFSPVKESEDLYSGMYKLKERASKKITLEARNRSQIINLLEHKHQNDAFDERYVDISGPMSIEPEGWPLEIEKETSEVFPLDIVYALLLPKSLSSDLKKQIKARINREKICSYLNGMVNPIDLLCNHWNHQQSLKKNPSRASSQKIDDNKKSFSIFYTNFCGNKEMAQAISEEFQEEFSISLHLVEKEYQDFINNHNLDSNEFKLMLISSSWPHPLSLLSPFFLEGSYGDKFSGLFKKSLNENNLSLAYKYAQLAEIELENYDTDIIPLGQINGCMRSHVGPFYCPPSGWTDYGIHEKDRGNI